MGRDYGSAMSDEDDGEDELEGADPLDESALNEDPESEPEPEPDRRRRKLERMLPEILKRAIEKGLETGIGTLSNSGEAIRDMLGDNVKHVPKELVGYVFSQVDETKNAIVRVVAGEVRDFLSATDLAQELQKALTSLSFEIRTEIRFIPNDAGGVKPEVKAEVEPKRKKRARDPDDEA